MYFNNCKTEDETKKAYRHLSKILHPDRGGAHNDFIEMEREYQAHLKSLHGTFNSSEDAKNNRNQYQYDPETESALMAMMRALQGLRLPETVDIQLCRKWIWVKGTLKSGRFGHYPVASRYIPQLEALGLKLHTMKGEMYFRDPKDACHNKSGKVVSFDRIARRYQAQKISNYGDNQLNN